LSRMAALLAEAVAGGATADMMGRFIVDVYVNVNGGLRKRKGV